MTTGNGLPFTRFGVEPICQADIVYERKEYGRERGCDGEEQAAEALVARPEAGCALGSKEAE